MTPDIITTSSEQEADPELQRYLLELINEVATEEGFKVETLPAEFEPYYEVKLNPQAPDRCIDGRKPHNSCKGEYDGAQLPGGTVGLLDEVKAAELLSESEARDLVGRTYRRHGFTLGIHSDDHHCEITDPVELEKYEEGCGNQKKKAEGKIPMINDVSDELVRDRQKWVIDNGGQKIPLTDKHCESCGAINLVPGTTFNTSRAAVEEHAIFNADVAELYMRAGLMFDTAGEEGMETIKAKIGDDRQKFQDDVTCALVRDYLQTARVLAGADTIHVRSNVTP
jgi:hypothetical protein